MYIEKIENIFEENIEEWYKLYYNFSAKVNDLSVQTKPKFTKELFFELLKNQGIIKFKISIDGSALNGIVLITDNLNKYPCSHYEPTYFSRNENLLNVKYFYLIGDLCGFILDDNLIKIINKNKYFFSDCIQEFLLKINNGLSDSNSRPVLVANYSERSMKLMDYIFLQNSYEGCNIKKIIIDEELFVILKIRSFHKLLLKILNRLMKFVLPFVLRFSIISSSKEYKLIFDLKNRLKLWKTYRMNSEEIQQSLIIYKNRLERLLNLSPQKLLYKDDVFNSYLNDEGYIKYILEDATGVAGLFMMISENFKEKANWVSENFKIYNGYVKLILTKKGSPSFYFSLLFLSSIIDFFEMSLYKKNEKSILLDYSININGERFNNDLRISKRQNFFKLIIKNGFLNELMSKLSPFKSETLDRDIYLTFKIND